jgi:lantibiotic modifying enzyme
MIKPTPHQAAIQKKIDEITHLLLTDSDAIPGSSLYGGKAGIALYFSYLSKWEKSTRHHPIIQQLIATSFDSINETVYTPAYSFGISGILWNIHHLKTAKLIAADDCFEELFPYLGEQLRRYAENNNFDFLHGAIGIGFYLLHVQNEACDLHLAELIKQLQRKGIYFKDTIKWESVFNSATHKQYNLSLSHGIASIIIFLSKCYAQKRYYEVQTEELLNRSLRYLLSQRNDKDKRMNSLYPNSGEMSAASRNSRLSWCYGDLGIAAAFWQAGKALAENKWKKEAIAILIHATTRKDLITNNVVDAGICHGTAGIAHIFNRFYWETKNPLFRDAADYWIEQTLQMARFENGLAGYKVWYGENGWVNQRGLLEGIAGIGLVLLSHLADEEPTWDSCFFLS